MSEQVPMPMTAHPFYDGEAGAVVRQAMATGHPYVQIFDSVDLDRMVVPNARTLTVKRCAGPAPYVGDPFCWMWDVAVDDEGRSIAGEARPSPV